MVERHVIHRGRKFSLERWRTSTGDGPPHVYEIFAHPGAAVVLPLLGDGRVVLIQNHRVAAEGELLELPAGTIDPPEPPIECARRELSEETGYSAGQLEPLLWFFSSPGFCTERMFAFLATDLARGPARLEEGEAIRVRLMPYAETLDAIGDGRIVDAKTIAALLYYDRYVRR